MSVLVPQRNQAFFSTVLPDGSWILFDRLTSDTVVLSASAGVFWELCAEGRTVDEIVDELLTIYPEAARDGIARDVSTVLADLTALNVLHCVQSPNDNGGQHVSAP